MAAKARQQYYADGEYIDKQAREFQPTMEFKTKIDSIEPGAQVNIIEDIKVNGTSLEVDDKTVDISIPLVIDNLYSTDGVNALSAKQGKVLYDLVQNLASRGRYLSNWNAATGLPTTNPVESHYQYRAGDYYVVSSVAAQGGTNYRPEPGEFVIGQASVTVETEVVKVTDMYLYDGTTWNLLINSTREIAIDSSLSTSSTNPVENRVVTNAINGKQDILVAGSNIQIASDGKTISATDTTYTAGTNVSIDANNEISAVDTTYTAGANVQISNENVISATDTTYAAGDNIAITNNTISATYTAGTGIDITNGVISNTQTSAEWGNITGTLSDQTDLQNALDGKQDEFHTASTTAPSNPIEGDEWYDTTNDVLKVYDGSNWIVTGKTYTAGTNIDISAQNVISADTQFVVVNILPPAATADVNKVYILGPIGTGADKYEEYIVTDTPAGFVSDSTVTKTIISYSRDGVGESGYDWNFGGAAGITDSYIGFNNLIYEGGLSNLSCMDTYDSDKEYKLLEVTLPYICEYESEQYGTVQDYMEYPAVFASGDEAYSFSIDAYTSASELTRQAAGKQWTKIGETSPDISGKQDKATSGSGAPSTTPTYVGQMYVDTANDNLYVATGTSSSSDWTAVDTNTTYTAGDGIDITNNEISVDVTDIIGTGLSEDANNNIIVDTTVVALKSDLTNYYTKTETYTKTEVDNLIASVGSFEVVATLPSVDTADTKKIYLLGPIGTGADKYEEWIVTEQPAQGHWESASTIDHDSVTVSDSGAVWNGSFTIQDKYIGIDNVEGNSQLSLSEQGSSDGYYYLTGASMPLLSAWGAYEVPVVVCNAYLGASSFDIYYSDSELTWSTTAKAWTKIGETSVDLSNYAQKSEVLTKTNTTAFTPTGDYQPATKKYADGKVSKGVNTLSQGETSIFSIDDGNWQTEFGAEIVATHEVDANTHFESGFNPYGVYSEYTESGNRVATGIEYGGLTMRDDGNYIITSITPDGIQYRNEGDDFETNSFTFGGGGNNQIARFQDLSGKQDKATSGSTAPSTTPSYVGQQYIDTTNDILYVATGTASSSDWTEVGAGSGDMLYSDFNWVTKTGATITLDLRSEITPSTDFTVNKPSTLEDGQYYILRVVSGVTAYTMTLGTNVTNPYSEDLTLEASTVQQFTFLAKGGNLELQPSSEIDISGKQDKATSGSTAPSTTPSYVGQQYIDTTNDVLYVATGTTSSSDWTIAGKTYSAGDGIDIVNDEISVDTDVIQEKLTAGTGIEITGGTVCTQESDRKGPAPSGFHVPKKDEWQGLQTIMNGLSLTTGDNWRINLHIPFAGRRDSSSADVGRQGLDGYYWSSTPASSSNLYVRYLLLVSSSVDLNGIDNRAKGYSVRCFKNSFEVPTASWTVITGTLGSAGIFWNQTEGLISITSNGTTGYTIQDKNIGATAVYNDGDTLTQANMGNFYQWGNNYGFPSTGYISNISYTQVDTSNYGPTNPYSSDTFITGSGDWSSVRNDDLWGNTSNSTHEECVESPLIISADTTVLATKTDLSGKQDKATSGTSAPATTPSYIGQEYIKTNDKKLYIATGTTSSTDWTLVGGDIQLAPNSPLTPKYLWYGTQAQYEALSQYYTDEENDTVYFTI